MHIQPSTYAPRHVVVLAHPNPHSFNGLVAETYCETVRRSGQEAIVRDLYAMGFDPLLRDEERPRSGGTTVSADVQREHDVIRGSDVFVLVYPIWFGMPPAMMKGYVDRVLGAGVTADEVQHGGAITLMKQQRLVSITSSGTSKTWLNQQDQISSLNNVFGRYLLHAFDMKSFDDIHFGEMIEGLSQDFIDPLVGQVEELAMRTCKSVAKDQTVVAT
jgi:NAD(P)H dehydrogenase (quinone)